MITPRRLAIVAAALSDDAREAARLARVHGFAGLLFDAYSPSLSIPGLSASGLREFARVVRAQDRQLIGLRVDVSSRGLGIGADVDRELQRLERAMASAAALAAPLLCVDLGGLPSPPYTAPAAPKVTPEEAGLIIIPQATELRSKPPSAPQSSQPFDAVAAAQVDSALVELGRRADRYSVTVAVRSDLASFAAIQRALKSADCPWFGLDLDPVAVLRDAWSMEQVLSEFGPILRHVRIRDAQRGAEGRTKPMPLGAGATDWRRLLADLDAAAYTGWLTIDPLELPDRRAAAAGALDCLTHLA